MFNKTERELLVSTIGNRWASLEIRLYGHAAAKIGKPLLYSKPKDIRRLSSRRAHYGHILNKMGIELPTINYDLLVRPSKIDIYNKKPEFCRGQARKERERVMELITNQ